jgi:hypothetical protein
VLKAQLEYEAEFKFISLSFYVRNVCLHGNCFVLVYDVTLSTVRPTEQSVYFCSIKSSLYP